MEIFAARQPIFNKDLDTIAYEILFRSSYENAMPQIDGDTASSHVLTNTYINFGLEDLTGGKNAFINFTENLLLKEIPFIFPNDSIVVEILENIPPTKDLIDCCIRLKDRGYTIALDDFIYRPALQPLVEIADIIKFDFMQTPIDKIYENKIKLKNKVFLAEKIETNQQFEVASKMGFSLFQGYFFCRPEIIKGKDIPANKVQLLKIVSEINKPDVNIDTIAGLIQHDVGLSYKLLRYINSAFYKKFQRITSIKDAALLIGLDELKKLSSLVVLTQMDSQNKNALLKNSSIRAKFSELIGLEINNPKYSPTSLFTMGLFSHIDALLNHPMNRLIQQLPLAPEISRSYVERQGPLYPVLVLISLYEKAKWEKVEILTSKLRISEKILPEIYLEACRWTDDYFSKIA